MDVQEMHIGVNLGVQKVDSNAFDNLLEEEIDYYLNKAQREYIRRQNIYLRESLDNASRPDFINQNEASENLGSLLQSTTYTQTDFEVSDDYDNAKEVDQPTDMFSYAYGQVQPESGGEWRACKLISTADIHIYTKTDYNKPIFRRYPIVLVGSENGNLFRVFYDEEGGDVNGLSVLYIKQPTKLDITTDPNQTPDLPYHTHDEIVDLAVGMITEDLKSARPYEQNQTTTKGEDLQ